jgi:hypothetical protein
VGPCALDYTRLVLSSRGSQLVDNEYSADPSADELIARHRIRASSGDTPLSSSPRHQPPPLQLRRYPSIGGSSDDTIDNMNSILSGRDYVQSLHQNHRSVLLYGKNNVSVCPVCEGGSASPHVLHCLHIIAVWST